MALFFCLGVAAGEFLFVFDADDPANPAPLLLNMGGVPSGIGILPDSTRAFMSIEGSRNLVEVALDTTPPQRLAVPPELRSVPLTLAAAPNAAVLGFDAMARLLVDSGADVDAADHQQSTLARYRIPLLDSLNIPTTCVRRRSRA